MTRRSAVYVLASTLILLSLAMAHWFTSWWLLLGLFVSVSFIQSRFTHFCPAEKALGRLGFKDQSFSITPVELYKVQSGGDVIDLVDVREPREFDAVHAEGARLVSLGTLTPEAVATGRRGSLDQPVYLICHAGGRSAAACRRLSAAGMKVVNVEGGTSAWEKAGLPVVRGKMDRVDGHAVAG
jgi:rhodanese-related sulfurtransferase